jgi:hypothetical protein
MMKPTPQPGRRNRGDRSRDRSGRLLTFFFLLFAASLSFARLNDKAAADLLNEKYRKIAEQMRQSYDKGDLNDVIDLYNKHCRQEDSEKAGKEKTGFRQVKKRIRADIYQWVVLSYMTLDMPGLADFYLRRLLALRPYGDTENYWLSIRNAAGKKYYTAPRLLLGFKGGVNVTAAHPVKDFSVISPVFGAGDFGDFSYQKDYSSALAHSWGTQWGCILEYTLTKNLSVAFQPGIRYMKFQYISRYIWEKVAIEGIYYGTDTTAKVTHDQSFYYLELPVLLKYRFLTRKFQPYVQVGGFYRVLETAAKSLHAVVEPEVEAFRDITRLDVRKQFTWGNGGFLVGAGIGFDTRGVRLEMEVNYKHVFNNIVDGDRRFDNPELMFAFYDVFDDINVNNWDISVKFLLPLSFKAFRR